MHTRGTMIQLVSIIAECCCGVSPPCTTEFSGHRRYTPVTTVDYPDPVGEPENAAPKSTATTAAGRTRGMLAHAPHTGGDVAPAGTFDLVIKRYPKGMMSRHIADMQVRPSPPPPPPPLAWWRLHGIPAWHCVQACLRVFRSPHHLHTASGSMRHQWRLAAVEMRGTRQVRRQWP